MSDHHNSSKAIFLPHVDLSPNLLGGRGGIELWKREGGSKPPQKKSQGHTKASLESIEAFSFFE